MLQQEQVLPSSSTQFLQGLGRGIGATAVLFYFWHTEAVYQLQQQWLGEQKVMLQQQQSRSSQQNIETIDLLMKSYAVTLGSEDTDMRNQLSQSGHLVLLQQLQQKTQVDISDLITDGKPFNAAQLYAALLRIKQQQEKLQARKQLDERLQQQQESSAQTAPNNP